MDATVFKQEAYFTTHSVYGRDDSNNFSSLSVGLPRQAANNCKF
jgi:hypothetical protein